MKYAVASNLDLLLYLFFFNVIALINTLYLLNWDYSYKSDISLQETHLPESSIYRKLIEFLRQFQISSIKKMLLLCLYSGTKPLSIY